MQIEYSECDELKVNNWTGGFGTSGGKITRGNWLAKNTIIILPEELQLDNNFVIKCFNATPNNDPNNEPAGILIDNLLHVVGDWKQLGNESGKPDINGNEE